MSEHHSVAIIGAGQAGLSVSHCLKQRGVEHVLLEAERIGHAWRSERWDSFCLVTPNWQCRLPGYPYAGSDPEGFMQKPAIVEYLEGYAASFAPPVREGVRVRALDPLGGRGFRLQTSAGTVEAEQVVVATGGYHGPRVPRMAAKLTPGIVQLHSSEYRNPESLPEGDVLVVGTGQSGCQIAEDLHLAGRRVHLCVGDAPRCARRYRGKDVVEWLDHMGYYDIPIDQHPNRDQLRERANHYVTGRDGGRDIDLRKFALEGMRLYGPLSDIDGDQLLFSHGLRDNLDSADRVYRSINRSIDAFIEKSGTSAPVEAEYVPVWEPGAEVLTLSAAQANITAVVWCVGFASDFGWIHLPVFDEQGHPAHQRGVTSVAGLYFIGLPWLHSWGSGRFSGVGRDAEHLAERIDSLASRQATEPRAGGASVRTSNDHGLPLATSALAPGSART